MGLEVLENGKRDGGTEPVGRGRLQSGHPQRWPAGEETAGRAAVDPLRGPSSRPSPGTGSWYWLGPRTRNGAGARDGSARWPLGDVDAFSGVKLRAATLLVFNLSN